MAISRERARSLIVSFCWMFVQNVESGIFGTSGATGFTKENEVFVGRVAMLGFAVRRHSSAYLKWQISIAVQSIQD